MKNGGQAGAMSRILVLMDQKENRRRLAESLIALPPRRLREREVDLHRRAAVAEPVAEL